MAPKWSKPLASAPPLPMTAVPPKHGPPKPPPFKSMVEALWPYEVMPLYPKCLATGPPWATGAAWPTSPPTGGPPRTLDGHKSWIEWYSVAGDAPRYRVNEKSPDPSRRPVVIRKWLPLAASRAAGPPRAPTRWRAGVLGGATSSDSFLSHSEPAAPSDIMGEFLSHEPSDNMAGALGHESGGSGMTSSSHEKGGGKAGGKGFKGVGKTIGKLWPKPQSYVIKQEFR